MVSLKKATRILVPYLGLIAIAVFFQIISEGKMLEASNYKILLNNILTVMLGACGLSFLMSMGNFDLSMAGIALISAIAGGLASAISVWLSIPAAILTGVFIGFFNGTIIIKLKIPDFVGTLAMSFLLAGFGQMLLGETARLTLSLDIFQFDTILIKLTILVAFVLTGLYIFNYSAYGRKCKACGSRIEAARLSGVRIERTKVIAYMISGFTAGLVALLAISRSGSVTVATAGNLQFNSLLALMIGGMPLTGGANAKYRSAIIGSISIGLLNNGMAIWGLDGSAQQFVRGIVFLIAIVMTFDRKNTEVVK